MEQSLNRLFYLISVRSFKSLISAKSDTDSLSPNTLMYLELISFSEKNTISGIAATLGISKPAVTMKMNELQASGLITKETSLEDKRINYIRLSDEVSDFISKDDLFFSEIKRKISTDFTEGDIKIFTEVINSIATCIEEANTGE